MAAPAAARTPAATPVPTTGVPQTLEECISILEGVFPDICHDYVSDLFKTTLETADQLIDHILTKSTYPRTKDKQLALKRKRAEDPDEEAARKYGSTDRNIPATPGGVRPYIRTILIAEFPLVPVTFIDSRLQACGFRLFSAYQEIFEAVRTYSSETPVYQRLQKARKVDALFTEETIGGFLTNPNGDTERVEVLTELQTARRVRKKEEDRHEGLLRLQQLEDQNTRQAIAEGAMGECGCCYGDFPLNRLVHCNGETSHEFCKDCARRNAETEVGKSKYELHCMSMDSCTGGFDLDQRAHFLDENTRIALDRNEQESVLRLAGIENLASCPFCPFAAEYPPVEIDREFRCQAPDCERISCRLCSEESHIPQSCEEYKKDKGLCVRRELEEAMSAALIRKCNKCGTPFVKLEGCNKMTCTRNGCNNIQCYVCSKSCGYGHFNDRSRGGKPGNCPLFDNVEERHKGEVSKAEKEALQRILAEHPEYTEDDLKVKISENVKDDDRRKDPRAALDELIRAGALRGVPHFNVPGQDALQG
ncbi:ring finger protein [Mollisia scopiformis]|uniref:Ring finger protein n=1 Tax=Mollisia scopiformis TaxID=149040 RepID=A0A132B4K3_MOLSC|nr:ring finger protein [Mollisia scopiformis]KUJ06844.1 ring finger protein [Mollisia scopiformis]